MKKNAYLLAGALLASSFLGTATATTVQFDMPNPIIVFPGETFKLTLAGMDFTTPADAGGFTFDWDSSVLNYVGTEVFASPWDTAFVGDDNALAKTSNKVDSVLIGTSGVSQGPDFSIADISFNVVGAAGDSSAISFADVFGGWATTGAVPIEGVRYVDAQVQVVPLPAAIYFFGSGMIGLFYAKRRS